MSSRRGLPEARKMRHDKHFVDELTNHAVTGVGQMVPVDQIETNPDQPRTAVGDLTELTASIRRHGVAKAADPVRPARKKTPLEPVWIPPSN